MYTKPLKIERHISKRGLPIVTSGDKSRSDSIFSTEVFGTLEEERYENAAAIPLNTYVMYGWALDEFKRLDRTIFECATTKGRFVLTTDNLLKKVPPDYEKQSPEELIGYGPSFLHTIWNRLDKSKFNKDTGKVANILMAKSVLYYTREDLFTAYQYVSPIAFREEDQDSVMVFNESNQIMAEIAKFASLIKNNNTIDTNDLKVYLQVKTFELYELNSKIYGSHGQIRQKILSRAVDSSARAVLLPATFSSSKIGDSRFTTDTMGLPIFHINRMFVFTVKRYFTVLLDQLFDHGCFDSDVTRDMLAYYDMEFIDKTIKQFEDNFFKVQNVPAIKTDGTFGNINITMTVDGETITKPLTWIEFFYIILVPLADIERKRFTATTRYPVDSDKSAQLVRPVVLTLADKYLKTVDILNYEKVEYYPFVDDYVKENYDQKIFEAGIRAAASVVVGWNGDHDGDAVSTKPLNSKEAVDDGYNYHNSLLSLFNYTGNFSRKVGKCAAQTCYSFTREPKKLDKSKKIDPNHEFIKYILSIEDGKIDVNTLYKWTTIYGNLDRPKISIYDTTTIKRHGKTEETTIGQLIFNKVIFSRLWDVKSFDYKHLVTEGTLTKILKELHQLVIEKKIEVSDIKRTVDLYCEFTLRLGTVYNSSVTQEMTNTDETFKTFRDKKFDAVRDRIMETGDVQLMEDTIKEIIDFAKDYYKDNDMCELFESNGKSSWSEDFSAMQIALGGLPSLTGDKPVIVLDALSDGIKYDKTAANANVGMRGAIDRGNETALAGELFKNISTAAQSIIGYRGDCGSKKGDTVNCDSKELIYNRYVLNKDGTTTKINTENVHKYVGKDIILRSPTYCKTKDGNFCSTCVGTTPFDSLNTDTVNLGLYLTEIASAVLNLFMKSTHELIVKVFKMKDFNDYIYPKPSKPMFRHEIDPIDGIEKVYTNYDIAWKIPKSAITPIDTIYSVLAHGSVIQCNGSDKVDNQEHSIILGTEVTTNPFEIVKPDTGENDDTKHFIFRYKKDDCVLNNTQTYKKTQTVYKMLKLYLRGNVSNLIPIEAHLMTLQNTFKTNKKISDSDLSVCILLATLARDAADVRKTSRETGSSEYVFVGTDDLVSLGGTFNAMVGPDAGRSMFISMARSFEEQTSNPSPIEKVFQS
ncbi:MAG: hypothetical protein ACRCX2_20745 [Paraclostridium sp.]